MWSEPRTTAPLFTASLLIAALPFACATPRSPVLTGNPAPASTPSPPPPTAPTASASSTPRRLTREAFFRSFLEASDLPDGMQQVKEPTEARLDGRDVPENMRAKLRRFAVSEWVDPHQTEPVNRVREMRAHLESEDIAHAAFPPSARMLMLRETVEIAGAPLFGEESKALRYSGPMGPISDNRDIAFFFRDGPLIVGVAVIGGSRAPDGSLTLEMAAAIVRRAEERTRLAFERSR